MCVPQETFICHAFYTTAIVTSEVQVRDDKGIVTCEVQESHLTSYVKCVCECPISNISDVTSILYCTVVVVVVVAVVVANSCYYYYYHHHKQLLLLLLLPLVLLLAAVTN